MERRIGTVSRGLRGPIIKEGDDLKKIVVDTLMGCLEAGDFEIGSKDVLAVTESILARAQKNYATTDQLAEDVAGYRDITYADMVDFDAMVVPMHPGAIKYFQDIGVLDASGNYTGK